MSIGQGDNARTLCNEHNVIGSQFMLLNVDVDTLIEYIHIIEFKLFKETKSATMNIFRKKILFFLNHL